MSFTDSVKSCFSNYATFSGRAPRSEFWWFQLFLFLVGGALAFTGPGVFLTIGLILPAYAVAARRLHDIEKSAWNILWYVIPAVGLILFLLWNCRKGTDGPNDYGADPVTDQISRRPMMASQSQGTVADKAEQLAKLKGLFESGAITQPEFDKLKADLLAT